MKPSASSLARAAACAASHALPQVRTTSQAAEDGKAIHAYLAEVAVNPAGKSEALAQVPNRLRSRCERIDLACVLDGLSNIRSEVAYAYDCTRSTTRLVGINIDREYGELDENEIACTLDVDAMRSATPVALDWKTGLDVGEVKNNWQMRVQALALRGWHYSQGHTVEAFETLIVYIDDAGATRIESHHFDDLDLDSHELELRTILSRVAQAKRVVALGRIPDVNVGDHCKYCPAMVHCQAHTALVRCLVPELASLESQLATLSDEAAGKAWQLAKQAGQLLTKIEHSLKLRAAQNGGLPLPNGKRLTIDERSREWLMTKPTLALLREHGASEAEIQAVTGRTFYQYPQERKA